METLIRIQKELKVPKDRYNKFGDFKYRNAEDVLKAVKPLLCSGETLITTAEVALLGTDVYFGVTATLRSGEHAASATGWAREEKTRPKMGPGQLSGAADSYAKKRALDGLFMLDDGFDADHPMPPQSAAPTQPPGPASWEQTPQPAPAQQPAPQQPPPAATPPQGQVPAPTPEQRTWLKALWDYYVSQAGGKTMDTKGMHKLLGLCQMHLARYPGSMQDVEQLKQWIKVEELCA